MSNRHEVIFEVHAALSTSVRMHARTAPGLCWGLHPAKHQKSREANLFARRPATKVERDLRSRPWAQTWLAAAQLAGLTHAVGSPVGLNAACRSTRSRGRARLQDTPEFHYLGGPVETRVRTTCECCTYQYWLASLADGHNQRACPCTFPETQREPHPLSAESCTPLKHTS